MTRARKVFHIVCSFCKLSRFYDTKDEAELQAAEHERRYRKGMHVAYIEGEKGKP